MNDFQNELTSSLRKYCEQHIEPHLEHDDEVGKFRLEIFQGLGEFGVAGITQDPKYGGAGLTYEDYCYVLEEIARVSVPYAVTISVSSMVQSILKDFEVPSSSHFWSGDRGLRSL
jgi:alkylation response protein AidB-like acyl-CoA dehydrogenase